MYLHHCRSNNTIPSFTHYSSYHTDGAVINRAVVVYYTDVVVNHTVAVVIMYKGGEQNT